MSKENDGSRLASLSGPELCLILQRRVKALTRDADDTPHTDSSWGSSWGRSIEEPLRQVVEVLNAMLRSSADQRGDDYVVYVSSEEIEQEIATLKQVVESLRKQFEEDEKVAIQGYEQAYADIQSLRKQFEEDEKVAIQGSLQRQIPTASDEVTYVSLTSGKEFPARIVKRRLAELIDLEFVTESGDTIRRDGVPPGCLHQKGVYKTGA